MFKPSGILEGDKITIGWCGNKSKLLKGFDAIIVPTIELIQKKYPNVTFKVQGFESLVPHEDMPKFYKDVDLYICASSHEGLPTPLVEACACGIPFVSTDVGIISEINTKGLNCVIERDMQSLHDGIVEMLDNPERMRKAGEENRKAIMAGWSWDTVSYIWENFILGDIGGIGDVHSKRKTNLDSLRTGEEQKVVKSTKKFDKLDISNFEQFELGKDPWSESFKKRIRSFAHYKTLQQLKDTPDIKMEDTHYYQWLMNIFLRDKTVWGILNSVEDIKKQYNKFMGLIQNPDLGDAADNVLVSQVKNGVTYYYGHYPVRINADGSFKLMDGHHRIAIKLFNNEPIKLTICDRDSEWIKLIEDLEVLYQGKRLYQPVDHPDFRNWHSGRDNRIESELDSIFKELGVKSVLDLGICHGYTLYQLRHHLDWAVGVEYNDVRARISDALFKQLGFRVECTNIIDFIRKREKSVHCVLALAVFHHIAKQHRSEFDEVLQKIAKKAKVLAYTLPEKGEPQYDWMPENIRDDMHQYIMSVTGYPHRKIIKLRSRHLVVLHK